MSSPLRMGAGRGSRARPSLDSSNSWHLVEPANAMCEGSAQRTWQRPQLMVSSAAPAQDGARGAPHVLQHLPPCCTLRNAAGWDWPNQHALQAPGGTHLQRCNLQVSRGEHLGAPALWVGPAQHRHAGACLHGAAACEYDWVSVRKASCGWPHRMQTLRSHAHFAGAASPSAAQRKRLASAGVCPSSQNAPRAPGQPA